MRRRLPLLGVLLGLALLPLLLAFERVIQSPVDAPCKTLVTNAKGAANAPIAVTNSATTVADAFATRCGILIINESGGGDMRCTTGAVTPTTTVGFLVAAGQSVNVGLPAQEQVRCIRTGATNATVSVIEER